MASLTPTSRNWLRWLPAAVVPAVIAVGVIVLPSQAGAAVDLPDKSPEEILQLVGESSVDALSGTLSQSSNLGLPELPSGGSSATAGVASMLGLLTGSHSTRVFLDGPSKLRLQVLDDLAERDLIRNGNDVWLYDSSENAATRVTIPDRDVDDGVPPSPSPEAPSPESHSPEAYGTGSVQTPAQLAEKFLGEIDSSTVVTVGTDDRVAGREVYTLVLTPRSDDTLVGSVSMAVDAATGLPLRVAVQARGETEPAFELGFTELSLDTPGAELFAFTPPPGATVEEQELPAHDDLAHENPAHENSAHDPAGTSGEQSMHQPVVSGTGWASVIELAAGTVSGELAASPLLTQLGQAVNGGMLLSSSLVNVLVTDDGRVFAGAVAADQLQAAATASVG
ncbi:LolA family protein [Glaciibacter superstes]|uniref:LolA family protein n=1 Tax=Glaciibacter superstes TaxID=501023 RepID=UPI0003B75EA6|nr:sigma-E factor regulatory protein RseB domain-containing protein [Glaciibacter superstes]